MSCLGTLDIDTQAAVVCGIQCPTALPGVGVRWAGKTAMLARLSCTKPGLGMPRPWHPY